MNKVRELKIDSTLWATPAKIIYLLDFNPEKLSVETKNNTNNGIKVHQVRYENGGFYLTIDNIKGYFNFSNNLGILTMIFANDDQQNKYHQIWKEILKVINRENGKLELHEKIKIIDSDLNVKYNNNSIYLVIDNLKGYFKYSKEKDRKKLKFIMEDQRQAKIYNQIWDKIKEFINSVDGVNFEFSDYFGDHGVIRFDTDDTLPLDAMVSVYSMRVVIRSVYRTYYDRFYANSCSKLHI